MVQVEERQRGEEADKHRRRGLRAPFHPPREEPHHRRRQLEEVPIVRVLSAGIGLIDPPPRPAPAGFEAEALRQASALGAQLKDLALPKDKAGRTVVNAGTVLRVIHTHRARPVSEANEEGIPRGEIDFAAGLVRVDGARWLAVEDKVPAQAIASDARILADYLDSFRSFFGNAAGAIDAGLRTAPRARAAFITPSHQFPTGVALSMARRLELLAWARRSGAFIVEDDYTSEFRYSGPP